MKPKITKTEFGSITINDTRYDYDVIIDLKGEVKKRKKKLSKAVYGSSHTISLDEARYIFEKNAENLIIGSGQYGRVHLSDEAANYFKKKSCLVKIFPTPEAMDQWNKSQGEVIGLFHLTC